MTLRQFYTLCNKVLKVIKISSTLQRQFTGPQVLAMYKKGLIKRSQSWIKVFLRIGGFPLTYNII